MGIHVEGKRLTRAVLSVRYAVNQCVVYYYVRMHYYLSVNIYYASFELQEKHQTIKRNVLL
jgi:hypothetical protein